MKMNRIILLLSLGIIACNSSKEDIAKKNIEEHLLKQMNDAKSYEFVSIDSLNTYSKFDSINDEIVFKSKEIIKELDIQFALSTSLDASQSLLNMGVGSEGDIIQTKNDIEYCKTKQTKLETEVTKLKDELKNVNLKNELVEYRTNIHFRGKNALGALMLNNAYVRLDKDLKVKALTIDEPKN